jgi:hypothetical protein
MEKLFVIHIHSGHGPTHYDLMLEHEGALATWQFSIPPTKIDQNTVLSARKLPDHRRQYLDYQGPISQGRGEVTRLDKGTCEVVSHDPQRWEVLFKGGVLRGRFELSLEEGHQWNCRLLEPMLPPGESAEREG